MLANAVSRDVRVCLEWDRGPLLKCITASMRWHLQVYTDSLEEFYQYIHWYFSTYLGMLCWRETLRFASWEHKQDRRNRKTGKEQYIKFEGGETPAVLPPGRIWILEEKLVQVNTCFVLDLILDITASSIMHYCSQIQIISVFIWERCLSVLNIKDKFKHCPESGWKIELSSFAHL